MCVVYMVSSAEPTPLRRLEHMIQNGRMAPSFERQYNSSIPRFYVVLHDAASDTVSEVSTRNRCGGAWLAPVRSQTPVVVVRRDAAVQCTSRGRVVFSLCSPRHRRLK